MIKNHYLPGFLSLAWLLQILSTSGQTLHLEIQPTWRGQSFSLGETLPGSNHVAITRLDGLLSKLALQRSNGSWLESSGDWHVFLSLEKGRLQAKADGLPAEDFKGIRFLVGLDEATDRSDPNGWDADHPLHPNVCGLHWGWSSGYVFLAMEGRCESDGGSRGFSYHLAGARNPMWVELPVKISGKRATTVTLGLEISTLLSGEEVLRKSLSTHSREGDLLAEDLKGRVQRAFKVEEIRDDVFQAIGLARASPGVRISERLPKVNLPADNALTKEGIELGRMLFEEKRLSRGNELSCASCHRREHAFTDGRRVSLGVQAKAGRRNAMAMVNLAWGEGFFWDGRAKTLREQALMPIVDAHEMNESLAAVVAKLQESGEYGGKFEAAFSSKKISAERIGLALEQFLLSLVSQDSKFDRAARKMEALSAQEQRGLELFVTENDPARGLRGADCFHCHGGNLFSNQQFMNNGLAPRGEDRGRMEATGLESDRGKFKVPTLRNVEVTGPYMHDGRFKTLEEVVDHYNGKLHRSATLDPNLAKHPDTGLGLSEEDKAALVAFLKTLTDEDFIGRKKAEPKPGTQLTQNR